MSHLEILGGLAALSAVVALWQLIAALRFPLHQRRPIASASDGITILKPLKGSDTETECCLRSWFEQLYGGPVQVLFGVASMDDSSVPIVRRLIAEYPDFPATLVHCGQSCGANAKVSTLVQLQVHAEHEFICVSDADVWVPPDFLAQSMARLKAHEPIGLVNGFYEFSNRCGLGMRWEALATNADFWSQVLQSAGLRPIEFALGAAMVFKRAALDQSGGFRAFADYLADDYHLGRQMSSCGYRIDLSPVVVECRTASSCFSEVWMHQLRWARTIRSCQPIPYFFSMVGNATLWPLMWWIASPGGKTGLVVAALLSFRAIQAAILEHRMTRRWTWSALWMAWLKDGLQIAVWAMAFLGSTVSWRGVTYRVDRCGKLTRLGVRIEQLPTQSPERAP